MKIGLSYSRCVRDIVDGVVDINEHLLLLVVRILTRMILSNGQAFGRDITSVVVGASPNGVTMQRKMKTGSVQ